MASRKTSENHCSGDVAFDSVAEAYLCLLKSRGIDWLFANAGHRLCADHRSADPGQREDGRAMAGGRGDYP